MGMYLDCIPFPRPHLQCVHVRVAARQLVEGVVALREVMEGTRGKGAREGTT